MTFIHQLQQYLVYWLFAEGRHSLHSPFLYDLYENVIRNATELNSNPNENIRITLMQSDKVVNVATFGANSRTGKGQSRSIKNLLEKGSTSAFQGRLLENLVKYYNCRRIVELGTSVGMATLYLSRPQQTQVITFEGNHDLCELAQRTFKLAKRHNIRIIEGNIDKTLQETVEPLDQIDFVYMDANHRYQPTIDYFSIVLKKCPPGAIIVLDDIHWSSEMTRAWKEISHHSAVRIAIDLFQMGIIFIGSAHSPGFYRLSV